MGLRDVESKLPPGFRFYPSDEELVCHYLTKKVTNHTFNGNGGGDPITMAMTMVDVDLHTHEPWELPEVAKMSVNEWYFFSFRDRKYATGLRANRATKSGYWKATGKDRTVYDPKSQTIAGMRKTLVFYQGRAPNGIKTSWVMHEFRLENPNTPPKEDWVLCRVFHKTKTDDPQMDCNTNYEAADVACQIGCSSSSQLVSSPPFNEQINSSFSINNPPSDYNTNLINMALLRYNFLDFPREAGNNDDVMMELDATKGDDFMFLLDMGMENQNMMGGGIANIGNVSVQGDNGQILF